MIYCSITHSWSNHFSHSQDLPVRNMSQFTHETKITLFVLNFFLEQIGLLLALNLVASSQHVMRRTDRHGNSILFLVARRFKWKDAGSWDAGTTTRGKEGGKKWKWKEGCALDQGQRESPLKPLRSKSLIYICASLLPIWHLSLLPVAPFPRSKTRIPPYAI